MPHTTDTTTASGAQPGQSNVQLKPAILGSISTGTLRAEDLIASFGEELEWQIRRNGDYFSMPEHFSDRDRLNALVGEWQDAYGEDGETVTHEFPEDLVSELEEALSQFAPPYCYFGAHYGDGADFGFWPDWSAIDELPCISDNSDEAIAAEQSENWSTDVRYVNDHGNVTVYGGDGSIILELV